MPSKVTLTFDLVQKRLLKEAEAAKYVGVSPKRLQAGCAVTPIQLPDGQKRYDIRDLDNWIEGLKGGVADDDTAILARLGT